MSGAGDRDNACDRSGDERRRSGHRHGGHQPTTEHILPSEKAFAYKMKLDAIKHQGIDFFQVGKKLLMQKLAKIAEDSQDQVQQIYSATYLIPELLEMVDETEKSLSILRLRSRT